MGFLTARYTSDRLTLRTGRTARAECPFRKAMFDLGETSTGMTDLRDISYRAIKTWWLHLVNLFGEMRNGPIRRRLEFVPRGEYGSYMTVQDARCLH